MNIIISNFRSIHKAYVQNAMEVSWTEAIELFMYHRDHKHKEDVQLFNLGEFKTLDDPTVEWARKTLWKNNQPTDEYILIPNTVRRCKNNLLRIFGIVLDFDENVSIIEAEEKYKNFEYVIYTTFRNLTETNEKGDLIQKFRMVIPFLQPIEYQDIQKYKEDIKTIFPNVDPASFSMSQSFYYHSGKYNYSNYNEGIIIDPYKDLQEEKILPPPPPTTYSTEYPLEYDRQYRDQLFKSLQSCQNLQYRNIVTFTTICKSIKLSWEEFNHLVSAITIPGSALNKESVRKQVWNSVDADKCKKETRDNFIKNHNGIPVLNQPRGELMPHQVNKLLKRKKLWI